MIQVYNCLLCVVQDAIEEVTNGSYHEMVMSPTIHVMKFGNTLPVTINTSTPTRKMRQQFVKVCSRRPCLNTHTFTVDVFYIMQDTRKF
jgi:hypothetical protein